jgi:hypothetical protein
VAERDADQSPPSSAEVKNDYWLYLLSPLAPAWRVSGLIYFTLHEINKSAETAQAVRLGNRVPGFDPR